MEAAYASRGVAHFAAWVHESDEAMRAELAARGYAVSESTRAMGDGARRHPRRPGPTSTSPRRRGAEYVRVSGLLEACSATSTRARSACSSRAATASALAAAMGRDHGDDFGVHGVVTREPARRRGFGTALTALLAHDAAARGCRTATLQATEMGERVYAAVGFLDLGRFIEFVP